MNTWIDHKYVNLLSSQLQLFKRRDAKVYNFRCPICGDSQKNRFKTRGYIMEKQDKLVFYCHNCSASMTMYDFIKTLDPELHKQYTLEMYKEKNLSERKKYTYTPDISKFAKPKYMRSQLKDLQRISQLHPTHVAKKYIVRRKIPSPYHAKLYYAPKFCTWINSIVEGKFDEKAIALDEPRIVIPFIGIDGNVFGVQGRALSKTELRYITIIFDDTQSKIFGLDTANFSKKLYITEGPFDSMFLPNCIAFAGSDGDLSQIKANDKVFVYDNEPRNTEIMKKVAKQIDRGNKVFIWPSNIDHKDINDCILGGVSQQEIVDMIDKNTYSGLAAKFQLSQWKKV